MRVMNIAQCLSFGPGFRLSSQRQPSAFLVGFGSSASWRCRLPLCNRALREWGLITAMPTCSYSACLCISQGFADRPSRQLHLGRVLYLSHRCSTLLVRLTIRVIWGTYWLGVTSFVALRGHHHNDRRPVDLDSSRKSSHLSHDCWRLWAPVWYEPTPLTYLKHAHDLMAFTEAHMPPQRHLLASHLSTGGVQHSRR